MELYSLFGTNKELSSSCSIASLSHSLQGLEERKTESGNGYCGKKGKQEVLLLCIENRVVFLVQRLVKLEIAVLVRSLKSSNTELG